MTKEGITMEWNKISDTLPPERKTVLTYRAGDLWPVPGFFQYSKEGDRIWYRSIEGPSMKWYYEGWKMFLFREPTHWIHIDDLNLPVDGFIHEMKKTLQMYKKYEKLIKPEQFRRLKNDE